MSLSEIGEHIQSEAETSVINDHEVQHRITKECEECNKLKIEIQNLLVSLNSLQLTVETMKCDDHKVQFYTRLPNFSTLLLVANFVSPKHLANILQVAS